MTATFGLQIPWFSWPGTTPGDHRRVLRDAAEAAEESGYSSLWVMDHFLQLPVMGDPTLDMHESYATLGYLAGVTERITLGTLVTGVTYRHPGILVKQVTSLDVLSGGRAWFAIGAAWFEREHAALGVAFPPVSERFERLEETLQIAAQMWSDDDGAFKGRHYVLEETICSPKPVSQPRPRIMIGGGGERKTLRLVARYADACNIPRSVEDLRRKLDVLRRHCDDVGRDYDAIERTTLQIALPGREIGETLADARAAVEAGIQHVIFTALPTHQPDYVADFGREAARALA